MKRIMTSALLLLAGLILIFIGGAALLCTDAFFGTNGIVIPPDASLRSEIRAPTGLLLVSGLLITASAFRRGIAALGLGLTALVYGTYGLSRLVSIGFDGSPGESLVSAMLIELVISSLALAALLRPHPKNV